MDRAARIFIGSSMEGEAYAYALQSLLEDYAEVTVWSQALFKPGQTTIEILQNVSDKFDFAIFMFTPDDQITYRGAKLRTVRDNLIFELGLFIGKIGLGRTMFLKPKNTAIKLPTDLAGVISINYNGQRSDGNVIAALGPASREIIDTIKEYTAHQSRGDGNFQPQDGRYANGGFRVTDIKQLERILVELEKSNYHGLALIDIDKLSLISNVYSISVVENILNAYSTILKRIAKRRNIFVSRLYGDTFIVMAPEDKLLSVVRSVSLAIKRYNWDTVATSLYCTCSIGVAVRQEGEAPEHWITRALQSVRNAKAAGGNCIADEVKSVPQWLCQSIFSRLS